VVLLVPPLPTGNVPVTPVVRGNPVQLVNVPDEGVPRAGVTKVGDVAKTLLPLPVFVTLIKFLLLSVATADEIVNPLKLREAPNAAPILGVVRVGDVPKTNAPDPVLDEDTAVARFVLVGVTSHASTPEPSPETPVLIGNPVQLVKVPLAGIPNAGVIKVGDEKVPPVRVIPVKVIADGKLKVGLPP
jgi:hypothetical protein